MESCLKQKSAFPSIKFSFGRNKCGSVCKSLGNANWKQEELMSQNSSWLNYSASKRESRSRRRGLGILVYWLAQSYFQTLLFSHKTLSQLFAGWRRNDSSNDLWTKTHQTRTHIHVHVVQEEDRHFLQGVLQPK
jgi:hypothetical protein